MDSIFRRTSSRTSSPLLCVSVLWGSLVRRKKTSRSSRLMRVIEDTHTRCYTDSVIQASKKGGPEKVQMSLQGTNTRRRAEVQYVYVCGVRWCYDWGAI